MDELMDEYFEDPKPVIGTWKIIVNNNCCPFFSSRSEWYQCGNWDNKTRECMESECPINLIKEKKC